jgi:hypothetical protein
LVITLLEAVGDPEGMAVVFDFHNGGLREVTQENAAGFWENHSRYQVPADLLDFEGGPESLALIYLYDLGGIGATIKSVTSSMGGLTGALGEAGIAAGLAGGAIAALGLAGAGIAVFAAKSAG